MTKLEQLRDIAQRLKEATGPDRDLEISMAEAVYSRLSRGEFERYLMYPVERGTNPRMAPKHFTCSIDDALALVNRVLPRATWLVGSGRRRSKVTLPWYSLSLTGEFYESNAPTEPLAILKALFAALIEQEETDEKDN